MFIEKVKAQTDGRTDRGMHDGQQAMTLTRWPMASGAKNVDKRTSDGRMDGRTQRMVSDHNSSLSTLCSGELKTQQITC